MRSARVSPGLLRSFTIVTALGVSFFYLVFRSAHYLARVMAGSGSHTASESGPVGMLPNNVNEDVLKERIKASILGAFVADAATMPLHWIYSAEAIKGRLQGKDPAFFDPPSCPFYQYELGALSPYGEEALPLLESVVEHHGLEGAKLTVDLAHAFSSSRGYLNHASKVLAHNVQSDNKQYPDAGAPDDQAHSLVKVPVVVGRYVGLPELDRKVMEATLSHQQGTMAVEYAVASARALEAVLLGSSIQDAFNRLSESGPGGARAATRAAVAAKHSSEDDVTKAVKRFGASCHLPGAFQGPVVAALHGRNFSDAVRANILAAGDQASRAHTVGALWGAHAGLAGIPAEWMQQVKELPKIEALVNELVTQRFRLA